MDILGIHIGHDANACLLRDGQVIADAQEERFTRIKHQFGVPFEAIRYCLAQGGVSIEGVDAVAFSGQDVGEIHAQIFGVEPPPKRKTLRRRIREMEDELRGVERPGQNIPVYWKRFPIPSSARIFFVEHHLAHAASTYYTAGEAGRSVIVTADGVGDGVSFAIWRGENGKIEPLLKIGPEGSLGWFYSNVTEALGWWHGDGEGKTMGLAPYGDHRRCQGVLTPYHPKYETGRLIEPHRFGPVSTWTQAGAYQWHLDEADDIRALVEKHGPENIAAEAQRVLEEQMFAAVLPHLERERCKTLCCSGGIFLNVKLNQRIWYSGAVERHHIFPNPGDAGLAVGAALYADYQIRPRTTVSGLDHVMWGPGFDEAQIEKRLREHELPYRRVDDVAASVAQALANGKIAGWFQGRMESGPRALGGRSIVMSAAKPENKDIINAKVKFREPFRPFCPSLIAEAAADYLVKHRAEPYMITSFDVQPDKRDRVPAVVHVDGTLRPQTVQREAHPLYWRMIREFGEITGDPLVLNTSFNIKGEPIVHAPGDAIRCFYDSGINLLAIGPFILEK